MGDNENVTDDGPSRWPEGDRRTELERMLEDADHDAELGLEMARDARRVTAGELSEAEFYDRYHEAVVAEFGEDDRPLERPGDGRDAETGSRFGVDEESRRGVMRKVGAGAGAVGLSAWAATADDDPAPSAAEAPEASEGDDEGTQWGMVLDLEQCDGCLSCVVACAEEHNWERGANWMYVLDYEESASDGHNRLIRPCQHCTDAPCEKVCPTTARHTRDSDGLVLTDYDVCIGCRYCQVACPYGVNYFQWDDPGVSADELEDDHVYDARGRPVGSRGPRGVMEKCTFCATRQDGTKGEEFVGRTACEDACPPEAIQFGDMNDPESDTRRYLEDPELARVRAQNPPEDELQEAIAVLTGETDPAEDGDDGLTEREARALVRAEVGTAESTFRLLEDIGTEPNIVYIGDEPSADAHQVDGPIDYDEVGHVDNRTDVLDQGTVGLELPD
ncbi:4Fe-4S dicluster domain-containing protein [Haloterrigena sp. SYSU A121-1]|uniref:4Fe-4S dicluster domain-containing protein n=1 Tax=Haloterrigena gelatinilytica TaxID=2741724 RepID=A0A8J8GMI4_9EURY|nr:4Fe-4S ferredoxin N-terminal domain-containing protein [Haloterrigena gelatinilytica]NUB92391.1 4Fe-4S dicluster domain-containing protein [Haloterrigena gelatinilytica]